MRTFLILFLLGTPAHAAINPSRIYADVRGVYVSTSPYCETFTEAFTAARFEHKDFLIGSILGTLDNSRNQVNGTYRCIMIKMNEHIIFVPDISGGNCALDVQYGTSYCDSGTVTTHIDGSTSNCTSGSQDIVNLYLSTASSSPTFGAGINPFSPPTATNTNNGIQLSSPLTIRGGRTVEFVINGDGQIVSSGGNCTMNPPVFSIR